MAEDNGLTMTQFITHCLEHWYEVSWNDIEEDASRVKTN